MTYSYPGNLIKFVQIFTLISIPIIISNFIENQDAKLQSLNKELENKYKEKEIEAKVIDEKNQELIVFSQIMSHDLKSPLTTIKAFSGLLKKSMQAKGPENKDLELLNFISGSANSMSELIDDLLMFSKIGMEDIELNTTDLNKIITSVLSSFNFDIKEKNVQIQVDDLPNIKGQGGILKTIFHNLISNAIKYQPKDKADHQVKINIWATETAVDYQIFIKDNGIGIKEDYIKDLFVPFRRFHSAAEYKGSGLGMSICKRIMEKHKGEINLKNTSKSGSAFQLVFPK